MPFQQMPDMLTPRETEQMAYDREGEKLQMEYGLALRDKEIELEKLQAKWSAWLRLPALILKLPLLTLLGLAYIVHVVTGNEPSQNFWNLLK